MTCSGARSCRRRPAQAMQTGGRAGTAQWPTGTAWRSWARHWAVSTPTWVAERLAVAAHGPAVLINPAVNPARDLANYIGEQTHWHDAGMSPFYFRPEPT
jgi:hypothetical protein